MSTISLTPSLKKRIFWLVLLAVVIGIFGMDSFLPSLPPLATDLHASARDAKLTISLYFMSSGIFPLLWGPLADRYSRKNILLIGLSIAVLGSLLCCCATSMHHILWGRFIQGVGLATVWSVGRALLNDAFQGKELVIVSGHFGMALAAMPACAPTIGGYIQHFWGWRANFITLLGLIVGLIFILWKWLPDHTHTPNRTVKWGSAARSYGILLRSRGFMTGAMGATFTLSGLLAYITISPFLFEHTLGLSPVHFGWLSFVTGLGIFLGSLSSNWISNRLPAHRVMQVATTLLMIPSLFILGMGIAGYLSIWVIILPITVIVGAMQWLFAHCYAYSTEQGAQQGAGTLSALYSAIQFLGTAGATIVAAYVQATSLIPVGSLLLIFFIPVAILIGLIKKP